MRLHLPFESPWVVQQGPGEQIIALLPGAPGGRPEVVVTFGPIVIKPDEPRPWIDQVVRFEAPAGVQIDVGAAIDIETADGWPLRLLDAVFVDGKGVVVEARQCAVYTFMEHAAVAIVRAADRDHLDRHASAIRAILERGRPDWRGDPVCLAEAWNLDRRPSPARRIPRLALARSDAALALDAIDRALATAPTAAGHLRRGLLLLELARPHEAGDAFAAAIALDPRLELAHYHQGLALARLGKHEAAIAAWERGLQLAPDRVDAHYHVARSRYQLRDYAAALAGFETVLRLDPGDLLVRRDVIQCLHALERHADAEAARAAFRDEMARTTDARARLVVEYVFDRFAGEGFSVHALETLRPQHQAFYPVLAFRAVRDDRPLPAVVLVETSDQAKAAGAPFVLAAIAGPKYTLIGAAKALPPYAELKHDVLRLLAEAVREIGA